MVADEVRALASKTNQSIEEIQRLISELEEESTKAIDTALKSASLVNRGVESSNVSARLLSTIEEKILKISDISSQVATATEEQNVVSDDTAKALQEFNVRFENVHSKAGDLNNKGNELNQLSSNLKLLVSRFNL